MDHPFEPYGVPHWIILAGFVAGIAPVIRLGRSVRTDPAPGWWRRTRSGPGDDRCRRDLLLGHKPPASVLDLLGPWPSYVGLEVLLVSGIWALMTRPWQRRTDVALERAGLHSEA